MPYNQSDKNPLDLVRRLEEESLLKSQPRQLAPEQGADPVATFIKYSLEVGNLVTEMAIKLRHEHNDNLKLHLRIEQLEATIAGHETSTSEMKKRLAELERELASAAK
jgi:hypothetical protein